MITKRFLIAVLALSIAYGLGVGVGYWRGRSYTQPAQPAQRYTILCPHYADRSVPNHIICH